MKKELSEARRLDNREVFYYCEVLVTHRQTVANVSRVQHGSPALTNRHGPIR